MQDKYPELLKQFEFYLPDNVIKSHIEKTVTINESYSEINDTDKIESDNISEEFSRFNDQDNNNDQEINNDN